MVEPEPEPEVEVRPDVSPDVGDSSEVDDPADDPDETADPDDPDASLTDFTGRKRVWIAQQRTVVRRVVQRDDHHVATLHGGGHRPARRALVQGEGDVGGGWAHG